MTKAQQVISSHGARVETVLATLQEPSTETVLTTRANEFVAETRALHSALPNLIRDNEHLFEELVGALQSLEQRGEALASERDPAKRQEALGALVKQGPGLTSHLLAHLHEGIIRFGHRVGASPALVVSGGVSLGSYQAGFLYYYTLFLHDRAQVLRAIPPEHRTALRAFGLEMPEDPPNGFTIVT
ncbi:MAG: hypothetical protein ACXU86_21590, partial [Archangium sp.]